MCGDRTWIPEPPPDTDDIDNPVDRVNIANAQMKLPEKERTLVLLLSLADELILHPEVERGRLLLEQMRRASEY